MDPGSDKRSFRRYLAALSEFGKELICPICLSVYRGACRFPCNHYFCRNCIERYLQTSTRCPVCKERYTVRDVADAPQIDAIIASYTQMLTPFKTSLICNQIVSPTKDLHKLRLRRRIKPRVPDGSKRLQVASPSFVFLLTGLDVSQRQTVTHICTHSSVRSVLEFSEEVTHCIASTTVDEAGDYTTNRTVKYLLSILTHKPIISFDWITEIDTIVNSCISKDQQTKHSDIVTTLVSVEQFPSWKPYTVKGDCQMAHCTKGGPDRSWSSPKNLFDGFLFVLIGDFDPPCPQKDEIVHLLLAGGGNIVQDTETRDKQFKQQHCDKEVLWIVDKRTRRPPRHANQVVYYKWILDSISGFQLLPFRFYLL